MIVLIAAVLAVALILVAQMQETAKQGALAIKKNAQNVFGEINDTAGIASQVEKKEAGGTCTRNSQCKSNECDTYLKVCK